MTSDFIKYGFEAEFIGRLPVRVACEPLKADDLADILVSSEGSILRQYESDFRGYGIDFSVTKEAVEAVAKLAYEEKTGARGLMTVLERTLRDFKFDLPSSGVRHFELDSPTGRRSENGARKAADRQRQPPARGTLGFPRRIRRKIPRRKRLQTRLRRRSAGENHIPVRGARQDRPRGLAPELLPATTPTGSR